MPSVLYADSPPPTPLYPHHPLYSLPILQPIPCSSGADIRCFATQGHSVKLRVQQDCNQILFSSVPAQQRPRHAFIPRWHFDMVQDHMRNDAYNQAISRVSLLVLSVLMQGVIHAPPLQCDSCLLSCCCHSMPSCSGGTLILHIDHMRNDAYDQAISRVTLLMC